MSVCQFVDFKRTGGRAVHREVEREGVTYDAHLREDTSAISDRISKSSVRANAILNERG